MPSVSHENVSSPQKTGHPLLRPLPLAAIVIALAAVVSVALPLANGGTAPADLTASEASAAPKTATTASNSAAASPSTEGDPSAIVLQPVNGTVSIDTSTLSHTPQFFDYDANGTTVEFMALKASDGTTRAALNTCQVCNGSPYAYFVETADGLQCQNCGSVFSLDQVGIASGGCNPAPISASSFTESDGVLSFDTSVLDGFVSAFNNWKNF
ncbi:DUF2318 domain-containing protein [Adlercreutzia equolifaciens]|uniref:DUF2318 domain-containing protein n=1 Tax=Adlercreutzia equolifaciens TaxID=446660 RepID=UPI0023AF2046|nr:DUF2318 domain-containing protein [Adlercreutzia equolifaciens]MDE8702925.1 DUF2318 domain-containing protein [Adlercreutzia equolifaciens]